MSPFQFDPAECPLKCDTTPVIFSGSPATWEDAVAILCEIESVVAPLGAHTALTGSCIYKGKSDDDIDIIIYPHNTGNCPHKDTILHALRATGKLGAVNATGYWFFQTNAQYVDKDVVIINYEGFRVDLFFFRH